MPGAMTGAGVLALAYACAGAIVGAAAGSELGAKAVALSGAIVQVCVVTDSRRSEALVLLSKWVARGLTQSVLEAIRLWVFNISAPTV